MIWRICMRWLDIKNSPIGRYSLTFSQSGDWLPHSPSTNHLPDSAPYKDITLSLITLRFSNRWFSCWSIARNISAISIALHLVGNDSWLLTYIDYRRIKQAHRQTLLEGITKSHAEKQYCAMMFTMMIQNCGCCANNNTIVVIRGLVHAADIIVRYNGLC